MKNVSEGFTYQEKDKKFGSFSETNQLAKLRSPKTQTAT